MKYIFPLFILAVLLIPVLSSDDNDEAGSRPDVFKRPSDEVYSDDFSKMVFPAKAGIFKKTAVKKNMNPVFGTVIRYIGDNDECADIYIYSLDTSAAAVTSEEFDEHVKDVCKSITSMPQKNKIIKKVSLIDGSKGINENKKGVFFTVTYAITVDSEEVISRLTMFMVNGRIIKIRTTYPAKNDELTDKMTSMDKSLEFEKVIYKIDKIDG